MYFFKETTRKLWSTGNHQTLSAEYLLTLLGGSNLLIMKLFSNDIVLISD